MGMNLFNHIVVHGLAQAYIKRSDTGILATIKTEMPISRF